MEINDKFVQVSCITLPLSRWFGCIKVGIKVSLVYSTDCESYVLKSFIAQSNTFIDS